MKNLWAQIWCGLLLSGLTGATFAQAPDPHGFIGTETVETRFGDFEFRGGYPTAQAVTKLYDLRTFNRAIEAYLI
jgi:hypothetical protein